jgi:uncharacterized membrane protein
MPPPSDAETPRPRSSFMGHIRNWLLTGLIALAPLAVTLYVFFRLFNWVDNLLGRYLRFEALDYRRIPGLGLVATLIILLIVGMVASWLGSWIGGRSLLSMWDALLKRIPGVGILYGSTKSVGEAFLNSRKEAFKQVVLVPWPHPGMYRLGFIAGRAAPRVAQALGQDVEVVFVPHTPNPASGFVHYVPKAQVIYLDWPIEDGLKVIISGGVVQPGVEPNSGIARGR